jgi:hypothetical protein
MKFPAHKCGLYLEHNVHRDYYESAQKWWENQVERECPHDWKDDESRNRAIASDEIWTLQWYPDTPIGSYSIAAPTLEELLAYALEVEQESLSRTLKEK